MLKRPERRTERRCGQETKRCGNIQGNRGSAVEAKEEVESREIYGQKTKGNRKETPAVR